VVLSDFIMTAPTMPPSVFDRVAVAHVQGSYVRFQVKKLSLFFPPEAGAYSCKDGSGKWCVDLLFSDG
jgi:hypothetical protein